MVLSSCGYLLETSRRSRQLTFQKDGGRGRSLKRKAKLEKCRPYISSYAHLVIDNFLDGQCVVRRGFKKGRHVRFRF